MVELKELKAQFFDCDVEIARLQNKKNELIQKINEQLTKQDD